MANVTVQVYLPGGAVRQIAIPDEWSALRLKVMLQTRLAASLTLKPSESLLDYHCVDADGKLLPDGSALRGLRDGAIIRLTKDIPAETAQPAAPSPAPKPAPPGSTKPEWPVSRQEPPTPPVEPAKPPAISEPVFPPVGTNLCQVCGNSNPPEARFCTSCGRNLNAPESAIPPAVPPVKPPAPHPEGIDPAPPPPVSKPSVRPAGPGPTTPAITRKPPVIPIPVPSKQPDSGSLAGNLPSSPPPLKVSSPAKPTANSSAGPLLAEKPAAPVLKKTTGTPSIAPRQYNRRVRAKRKVWLAALGGVAVLGVAAFFAVNLIWPRAYTLSTKAVPAEGGKVVPYSVSAPPGSRVTLTAQAAEGYLFTGWSDGAAGNSLSVIVTVDKKKTATANFVKKPLPSTTAPAKPMATPAPAAQAALTSIAILPARPSVQVGGTLQFTVTGTYSDASVKPITSGITWSKGVGANNATVTAGGLVTGVSEGQVYINATAGSITGSIAVTVTPSPGPSATAPGVYSIGKAADATGKFLLTATCLSSDGLVKLTIPLNTTAKMPGGSALQEIRIVKADIQPQMPKELDPVGSTYDFGQEGAIFSPPVTVVFSYQKSQLSLAANEKNLRVAWRDTQGMWNLVPQADTTLDTISGTVTARIAHFTPYSLVVAYAPASFTISKLTVSPATARVNEPVSISATVANVGDLSGTCSVSMKVNGIVETTQDVPLAGKASRTIHFGITRVQIGTYVVDVNGQTATLSVR